MKNPVRVRSWGAPFVTCVALAFATLAAPAPSFALDATGTLRGSVSVVDGPVSTPFPQTRAEAGDVVQVYQATGTGSEAPVATTETDGSGSYSVNLPSGEYQVLVTPSDGVATHLARWVAAGTGAAQRASAAVITISANGTTTSAAVQLPPLGTASLVLHPLLPSGAAPVYVFVYQYQSDGSAVNTSPFTGNAQGRGAMSVDVDPGYTYRVEVAGYDALYAHYDSCTACIYAPWFSGGAGTLDTASEVSVTPGGVTDLGTFQMQLNPTATVVGQEWATGYAPVDASLRPYVYAERQGTDAAGDATWTFATGITPEDTEYQLSVQPGSYRLAFVADTHRRVYYVRGSGSSEDYRQATMLTVGTGDYVTGSDNGGVNGFVPGGDVVSGTLNTAGSPVAPSDASWVYAEASNPDGSPYVTGAVPDANGHYTLYLDPGKSYRIGFAAVGFNEQYYGGTSDWSNATLVNLTGAPVTGVDANLTQTDAPVTAAAMRVLRGAAPGTSPLVRIRAPHPSVTGTPTAGRTLHANVGRLPTGERVTWQWLLNGRPIRGAFRATLLLTKAQAGHRISVRAVFGAIGVAPTAATSRTLSVTR